MNQINPLHLGGLLLVILLFTVSHLHSLKEELIEVKIAYKESEKLAVDLSSLKNVYANKEKTKKSINRILMQSRIKMADLAIRREKTSIIIGAKSIDSRALNRLLSKVLNDSFNISRLKIKRLSETKASLDLEIKW